MEEVTNKIMYHFHRPEIKPEEWNINNVIKVDENYFSYFLYCCLYKNQVGFWNDNGFQYYPDVAIFMMNQLSDEKMLELAQNKDEYLKRVKHIRDMLHKAIDVSHKASIYNREMGLEDYRLEKCPWLPSRLHSMWVCDDGQIGYWRNLLNRDCELYELSLTGKLFRTSSEFLPELGYDRVAAKENAFAYWNPPKNRVEEEDEYLFQGEAKILQKIII